MRLASWALVRAVGTPLRLLDARAPAKTHVTVPTLLRVHGVAPHMHLRGESIRVDLGAPEASSCVVDVPRWDFHLQDAYWLAEPQLAREATLTCRWDNRDDRQPVVNGRRLPARELRWGEGTNDEMCLAFLYATL